MAERETVDVDLARFLSDLEPRAMKNLASAAIGYHAGHLLEVLRMEAHPLWPVSDADLVSALLFATRPSIGTLRDLIEDYRDARVWEVRERLGEVTEREGVWTIPLRTRGQRRR
jgi:hypothetical protein